MHTRYLIATLIFFLRLHGEAQSKSEAVRLYDAGNTAFGKGDYKKADSLFTLSLYLEPHPDAYYNLAVCRRRLGDFSGFCDNLEKSAGYGDTEAEKIFWSQCAKRDTLYKKENGDGGSKTDFDIKECIYSRKDNGDFQYEKYTRGDTLVLSKMREKQVVYYRSCRDVVPANYKAGNDSLTAYFKSNPILLTYISEHHPAVMGILEVYVGESGKIIKVKTRDDRDKEASDLFKPFLLTMPEWHPATYQGKPVKFQTQISVTCIDTFISVYEIEQNVEIFSQVETMPEFPGGFAAMMHFILKNLEYPLQAKENGLSGKCFLRFIVAADGAVVDVQVLKGVFGCSACDQEAVRVVSKMPRWKPATQKGKPVPVFFNLPINFHLK